MIRVLVVGAGASDWSRRLRQAAPSADFESARLPAAAVRAFEKSPADIVILSGDVGARDRLQAVVDALRERPLGRLAPLVWLGDGEPDAVDVALDAAVEPVEVIAVLAELVGVELVELSGADRPTVPAGALLSEEAIERKLRQVRHDTYFDVLEVSEDVSPDELRDAFVAVAGRFTSERVSDELGQRFADELAEVRDGLEDAFAVLANDKLRAAYSEARRSAAHTLDSK